MSRSAVTLTITADTRRFVDAMRKAAEAINKIGPRLHEFAAVFVRFDLRRRHGAQQFTGDGLWQSTMCAAWVHDSCPLPTDCECTCHGGTLR